MSPQWRRVPPALRLTVLGRGEKCTLDQPRRGSRSPSILLSALLLLLWNGSQRAACESGEQHGVTRKLLKDSFSSFPFTHQKAILSCCHLRITQPWSIQTCLASREPTHHHPTPPRHPQPILGQHNLQFPEMSEKRHTHFWCQAWPVLQIFT